MLLIGWPPVSRARAPVEARYARRRTVKTVRFATVLVALILAGGTFVRHAIAQQPTSRSPIGMTWTAFCAEP
jgi:hypothetical protein